MDAAGDERDLKIQKLAAASIRDLEHFVPLLLFKTSGESSTDKQHCERVLRRAVREDGLNRLVQMLSPFQEMPQLLDPSLERIAEPLSNALIQLLSSSHLNPSPAKAKEKVTSPSFATCKLLYTLCQIRGHKVIVRFLSNEARYLRPLVESLEAASRTASATADDAALKWEEKYVLMLWLSHLVLTPFPLLSPRSALPSTLDDSSIVLPPELHLVSRTCSLALPELASSSRVRDAAVLILVHLVMRPDMVEPRLMPQLLDIIQRKLDDSLTHSSPNRTHEIIGSLALLAGIFNSVGAQIIGPYIEKMARYTLGLLQTDEERSLASSAVTRKFIIKVQRCSALAALALSPTGPLSTPSYENLADELMEEIIEQLLNCLGDPDTPVRFAASKALSVITLKLDPAMGSEITEAVLASLNEGVLWTTDVGSPESGFGSLSKGRDLSLVNPLRWQGLILTLSQLLFRKAPSQEMLPAVVSSLLLGLTFEQRTASGVAVGGPVRDAANFGIWALSRQYSTAELMDVETSSVQSIAGAAENVSLLQTFACELVCAACLDPSGNIRRGSSAALQELIGRHPDTVIEGIGIVQTVDYHAVALRSSALTKVAPAAARLSEVYRNTLLAGSLGWRGVLSTDAESRRWAAEATGRLAGIHETLAANTLLTIRQRLGSLQPREVEARHGLTLAAEQVIETAHKATIKPTNLEPAAQLKMQTQEFWSVYENLATESLTNPALRPFLTCEAIFRLLASLCHLSSVHVAKVSPPEYAIVQRCTEFIELCAPSREDISMHEVARAAQALFESGLLMAEDQNVLADKWVQNSDHAARSGESRQADSRGWIVILSRINQHLTGNLKQKATDVLTFAMTTRVGVEVRVAALQALQHVYESGTTSTPEQYLSVEVVQVILKCMGDFTTDQRGDVGSLIRVAALHCASKIDPAWLRKNQSVAWTILASACGLSVEKLDRVRTAAWPCLVSVAGTLPLTPDNSLQVNHEDTSSTEHFLEVLTLAVAEPDHLLIPTLIGLVTSVGNGPESVLRAAREAIQLLLAASKPEMSLQLVQALMKALAGSLDEERLAPQALTTMAFIFETGTLNIHRQSREAAPVFREMFALVQKAHFKSTSLPRLTAALDIYTSLVAFTCVHTSALKKLLTLLAHPFPLVRRRAAESLYCATNVNTILSMDWSKPPSQLKTETAQLKEVVLAT